MPETAAQDEVRQHLAWLRLYADTISETNWRDMQVRITRQVDRLANALELKESARPPTASTTAAG